MVGAPTSPAPDPRADTKTQAALLAQRGDVRGLERLKSAIEGRRSASGSDGSRSSGTDETVAVLDDAIASAQRNRLAADAALFKNGSSGPAPPAAPATAAPSTAPAESTSPVPSAAPAAAPPANAASPASDGFAAAFSQLRPSLERIARAAGDWAGGNPPAEFDTLSSVLPRLHNLRPPSKLAAAYATMCASLDQLIVLWASAAVSPVPAGELPVVRRAVTAIGDALLLERTVSTPSQQ